MEQIRFRILGPMEMTVGNRRLSFGPAKQAAVLAALLVDAGSALSLPVLIERVWGEDPPARARETLHSHIARIRSLLKAASPTPILVNRRSGGYVLEAERDWIDLFEFRQLWETARAERGSGVERLDVLRRALGLWRGEALDGMVGGWADQVRTGLRQQRLGGYALWARFELEAGRPDVVIEELSGIVAGDPLVESLVGWLMRALCLAGRGAEALACYAQIRRRLADELGTEPGAELRELNEAILRGEVPVGVRGAARPVLVPHQLPADVAAFTGRAEELAHLDDVLRSTVAMAISGTAGVGKTALAVHWAHQVSDVRFPDGQLYVNLHGHDADLPADPADVLARFLLAIGGADQYVPAALEDRAASFRTLLAERRVLIVLDNASHAEQIRPLLPGSGASRALVTSRDSLAGLVARDGAYRLDLDLLPTTEAWELLRRLIGQRVDADPEAATRLAEQCVRLPLALRVAAELAATRRGTTLAHLVAELSDQQQRLRRLDAHGDSRTAVTAVFSWSIQHLPADATRAFRLLALHPGPDFEPYAAAALLDTTLADADRLLGHLARAHLVHPTETGRYGVHDLLRAYAHTLPERDDDRRTALTRLFDYYLNVSTAAVDRLHPASAHYRPRPPTLRTPVPTMADADVARTWLDSERPALAAAATYTAGHGWPTHTMRLSTILGRYLTGGHTTDAVTIHGCAREAARTVGDRSGEAYGLLGLGIAYGQLSRYAEAAEHLLRALALFRQVYDPVGEGRSLTNLGNVEERQGHHAAAFDYFTDALALYQRDDDAYGQAGVLNNIGITEGRLGRYGPAAEHLRRALLLSEQVGDQRGCAIALTSLGYVDEQLGHHQSAVGHLERALLLFQRIGERRGHAYTLTHLGSAYHHLRLPTQAVECHERALVLFRETDDRDGQARALNGRGETAGTPTDALSHHTAALAIASDIGAGDQQARAHSGLGHTHQRLGDLTQARHHYAEALRIYADLSTPHADRLRAHLAALD